MCVYIFPCTSARGVHYRHIAVNVNSTHVSDTRNDNDICFGFTAGDFVIAFVYNQTNKMNNFALCLDFRLLFLAR